MGSPPKTTWRTTHYFVNCWSDVPIDLFANGENCTIGILLLEIDLVDLRVPIRRLAVQDVEQGICVILVGENLAGLPLSAMFANHASHAIHAEGGLHLCRNVVSLETEFVSDHENVVMRVVVILGASMPIRGRSALALACLLVRKRLVVILELVQCIKPILDCVYKNTIT